jgi:hypothetical protein
VPIHLRQKYPPELKTGMADDKCMICERLFRVHSEREFEKCMDEIVKRSSPEPIT